MKKFIKTNSINAVGAGQTATLDLSTGLRYNKITLNYERGGAAATQAQMISDIEEVRIKVDGKVQRIFSAAQLFDYNSIDGYSVTSGFLDIYFAEPHRRSANGEDALAWGTANVQTFQMEIDIAAGAVSPVLSASMEVDDANTNMGPIVKWRRRNVSVSGAGLISVTDFDKLNAYYSILAYSTDINAIALKLDQNEKVDATVAELNNLYSAHGVAPPAGTTLLAFDYDGRVSSALALKDSTGRMVSEFLLQFDMAAATSFTTISKLLGQRD